MPNVEFLRSQAANCLRIARACFDLTSAERMRLLATELKAKADELEKQKSLAAHMNGPDCDVSDKKNRQ